MKVQLNNAKSIKECQDSLKNILMPWEKNQNSPSEWVRKTAMGKEVAKVSSWLGGYSDPRKPEVLGWGVQKLSSWTRSVHKWNIQIKIAR